MPHINIIEPEVAEGRLHEIYTDLEKSRGKIAEVHKLQSLNPESIVNHMDLYMTIMFGRSPLKRYQREMIAVMVSVANKCEYCMEHHGSALNHFWKDDAKLAQFKADYTQPDLSEADQLLCAYALELTHNPGNSTGHQHNTAALKSIGFDDRAILDATMICSYFNFVNRMVMGLGVTLEQDKGEGYHYD